MDTIIGLGKAGCAIADKFAEYPQYKIFKIDSEALDSKSKNCHLIKRRHTPEEYEKTIRTMKTFFSKTTEDILFPLALPQTSGDDNFVTNAGSIENKGIEATLGVTLFDTEDLTWDVDLSYAYNENKVTDLGGNPEGINIPGFGTMFVRDIDQDDHARIAKAVYMEMAFDFGPQQYHCQIDNVVG